MSAKLEESIIMADQEVAGGTAVRVCSPTCSPGSRSSAVSCKESPDEGEFLNYQSSELRTANSECFSTHSSEWDSKSEDCKLSFPRAWWRWQ